MAEVLGDMGLAPDVCSELVLGSSSRAMVEAGRYRGSKFPCKIDAGSTSSSLIRPAVPQKWRCSSGG